jgi:hypothetical protein
MNDVSYEWCFDWMVFKWNDFCMNDVLIMFEWWLCDDCMNEWCFVWMVFVWNMNDICMNDWCFVWVMFVRMNDVLFEWFLYE